MSIIQTLTEGIVNRDMKKEGSALLNKWGKTGLLEGLQNEQQKHTMARLLENQAKELLRESNTMAGGNIEGFAAVAFPIVRRVFAGLIANDLVSVQPMSLPSGLIFFLDFTFDRSRAGAVSGDSIYGQGVVGSQITGGVSLSERNIEKQPYSFNSAYAAATASVAITAAELTTYHDGTAVTAVEIDGSKTLAAVLAGGEADSVKKLLQFDPDAIADTTKYYRFVTVARADIDPITDQFPKDMLVQLDLSNLSGNIDASTDLAVNLQQVRRLTSAYEGVASTYLFVIKGDLATDAATVSTLNAPIVDNITNVGANTPGALFGTDDWALEGTDTMPEIDIKVDSIPITAATKKLKAKWTPELGQDLNAYHNLDAEVELTSILSEQIALEIDREILQDLVRGATASTYYWARSPGLFVNRETGAEIGASALAPDFTGTVSEWYETLIETINDVSAQIHRKTLRGGANFVVVSPEVANILEFTSGFRANITADADKGDIGAVKTGSLSRKFDVIVDPYFPRNVVLVGRKGSSFLESGYVYAPYIPLQTTPTIFGPDDFVPRKGVMTRYGKKMVRPDMYGLVIVRGLLGESGG
jgi:hypothetical protein